MKKIAQISAMLTTTACVGIHNDGPIVCENPVEAFSSIDDINEYCTTEGVKYYSDGSSEIIGVTNDRVIKCILEVYNDDACEETDVAQVYDTELSCIDIALAPLSEESLNEELFDGYDNYFCVPSEDYNPDDYCTTVDLSVCK